jgi:hypothetical protein
MIRKRTESDDGRPRRLLEDLCRISRPTRHLDLENFGGYICEAVPATLSDDIEDHLQGCESCAGLLERCYENSLWDSIGGSWPFSRQAWDDCREAAQLLIPARFGHENRGPRTDDIRRILSLFGSSCHTVMEVAVERFKELRRDFFDSVNQGLWALIDSVLNPGAAAEIMAQMIPEKIIAYDEELGEMAKPPTLTELMTPIRLGAATVSSLVSRENMSLVVAQADTPEFVRGSLIRCANSNLLVILNRHRAPSARAATLEHEILEHWVPILLGNRAS